MKMMRVLSAVLCVLLLCGAATVSAEDGVIATFAFSNEGAVVETNIELNGYGDKDKGYNSTTGDAELYASVNGTSYRKLEWTKDEYSGVGIQPAMTGGNNNPWGEGAYLEVQVSTLGCTDVAFSAQLGATKKGPRDYQLQYSLDGVNFTDVGEVYSITDNKVMEQAFDRVALPADAANAAMLYIRMAVVSDQTVGGEVTLVGSTGGETAVNNVTVYANGTPVVNDTTASTDAADTQNGGGNLIVWIAVGAGVLVIAAVIAVIVFKKKK